MEQSKKPNRYSVLKESNHRKMKSFQLKDEFSISAHEKKATLLLQNSKSSVNLQSNTNTFQLDDQQTQLPRIFAKNSHRLATIIVNDDKQNRQKFFNKVYNHKISKLITSNTSQQKQRYMRKLHQALSDDTLRAIGYEFNHSYIPFINQFLSGSNITKIVLDNNPLGDAGVIKLTAVFPKISLKQLSLVSVNMGNAGASVLFNSLKEVTTLLKLNISTGEPINKNKLSAEAAEPLKQLLSSPNCNLETLNMNHLLLGSDGAKIAFEGVTNSSLECLSLSKADIGVKNIGIFIQSLSKIPLMRLDLSKNNIRDAGIKYLTDVLGLFYSKNSISMNLTYLNIGSNFITSQGFEYFCRQTGMNRTLEILILDDNPLGQGDRFFNIKYYLSKNWGLKKLSLTNISPCQKDVKFVCQGLQSNRSLEQLNLSKNEIDSQILGFIFFMLTKNKALRRIILNSCKISDSYLLKNEYMLSGTFSAIEQIDFENNYINLKGAQLLKKVIGTNKNILKLSLAKNCIPETCIDAVNEILKENQSKRPFQHELNYFSSVSDLYEEKKKALIVEVQSIRQYEEKLQTRSLVDKIQYDLALEQNLKKKIVYQQTKIKNYESKIPVQTIEVFEDGDPVNFITSVQNKC